MYVVCKVCSMELQTSGSVPGGLLDQQIVVEVQVYLTPLSWAVFSTIVFSRKYINTRGRETNVFRFVGQCLILCWQTLQMVSSLYWNVCTSTLHNIDNQAEKYTDCCYDV